MWRKYPFVFVFVTYIYIFCAFVFLPSVVNAAEYYVRADGTALSKSSATGPVTDADAAMSLATFHTETFLPGDTVYFSALGGDYTSTATVGLYNAALHITSSGNSSADVRYIGLLDGVGDAKPLIDVSGNASNAIGISIQGQDYIILQNFRIKGSGGGAGLNFGDDSGLLGDGYTLKVRDVDILSNYGSSNAGNNHDCFSGAPVSGDRSQAEFWNITATGCRPDPQSGGSHQAFTLHEYEKAKVHGAIFSDSNHWYIGTQNTYAEFDNITADSPYVSGFGTSGSGAEVYVYDSDLTTDSGGSIAEVTAGLVQIQDSTITSTLGRLMYVAGTLKLVNNTMNINDSNWRLYAFGGDIYLTGNLLNITNFSNYFTLTDAGKSGGVYLDGNTFLLDDAEGLWDLVFYGQSPLAGGYARNNIFVNFDGYAPIRMQQGTAAFDVYNNVFYDSISAQGGVTVNYNGTEVQSVNIKNNVFYNMTDSVHIAAGGEPRVSLANNIYYQSSNEGGVGSLVLNPQFAALGTDFNLQATSSAINAGTSVLGRTADILGNSLYGNPDIGAYEYQWVSPVSAFTSRASDLTVTFTDTSTDSDGTIASWHWDFGDSNTSASQNPVHTYASSGAFDVVLTVTDNHGATDSHTNTVRVSESPNGSSGGGIYYGCKDTEALNYERFVRHDQALCEYEDISKNVNSVSSVPSLAILREQVERFLLQEKSDSLFGMSQTATCNFFRNLQLHSTGEDVRCLQQYLNANGFMLSASGPGSPNQETRYFGVLTYGALSRFQNTYASQILKPLGIPSGTGYFGPSTRAFISDN